MRLASRLSHANLKSLRISSLLRTVELGDNVLVDAKIRLGFFQKYGKTGQASSWKTNSVENIGIIHNSGRIERN
jgi:hypothetical protein